MFESDICICGTTDCPKYNECLRGTGMKRSGIYTMSYFGTICNEENGYMQFIKFVDGDYKEIEEC